MSQNLLYSNPIIHFFLQNINQKMKSPLALMVDDEYNSSELLNCWWRSTALYEEYAKLTPDPPTVRNLKPGLRVLRELERLGMAASDGLNEIRDKLLDYSAGDLWVPTGGIWKEHLDIPPVITILLVGFTGSGKSSLINLMYSFLSRSGLLLFAQTSTGNSLYPTTQYMEEHNVLRSMENGFCVFDSRGFTYDRVNEGLEELSTWMTEGVRHNQPCTKSVVYGITNGDTDIECLASSPKFVKRKVNCAMVVVNMAEIYEALKKDDTKPLEATRQLFCSPDLRKCNEDPILIFTHGDMLSAEDRIDARLKICSSLGVSDTDGVYDIECLTEYGFLAEESDPVTCYALSEAIYRALLISDRGHLPNKSLSEWVISMLTWFLCILATLFAFLSHIFSTFGEGIHKSKRFK